MSLVTTSVKTRNVILRNNQAVFAVAVGQDATCNFAYSSNGINWTRSSVGLFSAASVAAVAYNGSQWIAGGVLATGSVGQTVLYYSTDGIDWVLLKNHASGTAVFTNTTPIKCISQNGNVWIAGGSGTTKLIYSYDSQRWDSSSLVVSVGSFNCFCWIDAPYTTNTPTPFFLAGTNTNQSMCYSYNGTAWFGLGSSAPFGTSGTTNCIAWNGSSSSAVILAGSSTGAISRTTFGSAIIPGLATWTSVTTPFTVSCNAFCWNGQIWVAGGDGTNRLAYSYDGITWTAATGTTMTSACSSITWNGSVFIATGSGTNRFVYSSNGINWTAATAPFATSGLCVFAFSLKNPPNPDGLLNSSFSSSVSMLSTAPNTIELSSGGNTNNIINNRGYRRFTTDELYGTFIKAPLSIGYFSTGGSYSLDGINWLSGITALISTSIGGVRWNGSIWLAPGRTASNVSYYYSYDGINWVSVLIPNSPLNQCNGFGWNGSMWIAGATANGAVVKPTLGYSYDGINWSTTGITSIFSTNGTAIEHNGSIWVAVGENNNSIAYSLDGFSWVGLGTSFIGTGGSSIIWNGEIWVATGLGNIIAVSYDGINWFNSTNIGTLTVPVIYAIAWSGFRFVASCGGTTNTLIYSTDGITWTGLGTTVYTGTALSVMWDGRYFVAFGTLNASNVVAYSSDGISWSYGTNALFMTALYGGFWNWNGNAAIPSIDAKGTSNSSGLYNCNSVAVQKRSRVSHSAYGSYFNPPTLSYSTSAQLDSASTLMITGAPNVGDNVTGTTKRYALNVVSGSTTLSGTGSSTASTATFYIAPSTTKASSTSDIYFSYFDIPATIDISTNIPANAYTVNIAGVPVGATRNFALGVTGAVLLNGTVANLAPATAQLRLSTTQNLTSGSAQAMGWSTSSNPSGFYTVSTGNPTTPTAGTISFTTTEAAYFMVSVSIAFGNNGSGIREVYVSDGAGNRWLDNNSNAVSADATKYSATSIYYASTAATYVLTCFAYHTAGVTLAVGSQNGVTASFSVTRII